MATLLAGFAFTAFISMDTVSIDINAIRLTPATGAQRGTVTNSSDRVATVWLEPERVRDLWVVFGFAMHLFEIGTLLLCLSFMLHVMTETLIAVSRVELS